MDCKRLQTLRWNKHIVFENILITISTLLWAPISMVKTVALYKMWLSHVCMRAHARTHTHISLFRKSKLITSIADIWTMYKEDLKQNCRYKTSYKFYQFTGNQCHQQRLYTKHILQQQSNDTNHTSLHSSTSSNISQGWHAIDVDSIYLLNSPHTYAITISNNVWTERIAYTKRN